MTTQDAARRPGEDADDLDDARLLDDLASGEAAAFGTFYERYRPLALRAALRVVRSEEMAEDVVADAFTAVLATVRGGGGPTSNLRAYLLAAVRHSALAALRAGARTQPVPDDALERLDAGPGVEAGLDAAEDADHVRAAFAALPPRWRRVLWYVDVRDLTPTQVAPLVGSTPNAVSTLVRRAREGLRHEYLQHHLRTAAPGCVQHARHLGALVRGSLAGRHREPVLAHVATCAACSAALAELRDVNGRMRALLLPWGLAGAAVLVAGAPTVGLTGPTSGALAARGADGLVGAVRRVLGRLRQSTAAGSGSLGGAVTAGILAVAVVVVVGVVAVAVLGGLASPPTGTGAGAAAAPGGAGGAPAGTAADGAGTEDGADPGTGGGASARDGTGSGRDGTGAGSVAPHDGGPGDVATGPGSGGARPPVGGSGGGASPGDGTGADPGAGGPARPPVELTVLPVPVGDLVRDRPGVVAFAVSSASDRDSGALTAEIALPAGVVASPGGASSAWSCSTSGGAVRCTTSGLGAGATSHLLVPVDVSADAALGESPVGVELTEAGARAGAYRGVVAVRGSGAFVRYVAAGAVEVSVVGAPVLHCPATSPRCAEVVTGTATGSRAANNVWSMVAVDALGRGTTSSSAQLGPVGEVVHARLYWSGVCPGVPGSPVLVAPDGSAAPVVDDVDVRRAGATYHASADVTRAVRSGGAGPWGVADVCATPGLGNHGGWALMVVHTGADDHGTRLATVLDGFGEVAPASSVAVTAAGVPGTSARVGLVAWDGDRESTGDRVRVSGRDTRAARWDGTGSAGLGPADDVLDSTAWGSGYGNSLGVDAKQLEPVPVAGDLVEVRAETGADRYVLGAVTVLSGLAPGPG
ncbi:sigma-70 family RNA polymerase sigma factor [Cellulosimicrobium cellulans]|uniref:sigma-70 family RNA polymerase sigma factor n=1 Tax=Cellulosimicrobium cellulans TaxID=1710 RepID=UPI002405E63F|nr:sigma-70 family RNA polymerase sigma factor [Cellulosimicrobium cellulans]MDF9877565.1 RNA polymerase sigma factor (sigma-70 family) [Cellulosimicrobium cellulans]